MTSRRRFLQVLGAGAATLALPGAVRAQASPARIAWLSPTRAADGSLFLDELRRGFSELGHVEGRNLIVEPRWGENSAERVDKLIAETIASRPQVIVAQGSTALTISKATRDVPVVFGYSGDPVEAGMVDSFARPGRNLTGLSYLVLELVGKRVELLKEVLPGAKRIAVIANPQHPGDQAERRSSQNAASALGLTLEYYEARNPDQLNEALAAIEKSRNRPQAVMLFPVQNVINARERIAAWSLKNRIPTMSGWSQFAEGGNLMSYGPNLRDASRRMAWYSDRILKGARPTELPVELPSQVELVINTRAAKALGVNIPKAVLVRANQVI